MGAADNDVVALRRLVDRYASAVDRRDAVEFVDLFYPDAVLQVFYGHDAAAPTTESRGHEALARIPTRLGDRYIQTFHFVGNFLCEIRGEEATGEAYCLAHHVNSSPHGGTDYVMAIRYQDVYRRGADGEWRFTHRRVLVCWTEFRTTLTIGEAAAAPVRSTAGQQG
jgi:ketosteroid isomerase-like protein